MNTFNASALPFRPRSGGTVTKSCTDSRSAVPCKFFMVGNCLKGSQCPFEHPSDLTPPNSALPQDPEHDDAETEDFSRTIAGAFVNFEDGGRASKICFASDFSAVHLGGFPDKASLEDVQGFLTERGFYVPEKDIRIIHQDGSLGANVQAEDPYFSKKLCALVKNGTSRIKATPIAVRMPSGHMTGRVDCKKVHLSWHKAVRTVWLNFGNGNTARRVSHKFATSRYTVLAQKVLADTPSQARGFSDRFRNPLSWTVRLRDVPGSAGQSDISRAITAQGDKPGHIEMGPQGYSMEDDHAAALVRSLLTRIGPVEYWEVTPESTAKRIKATARFFDDTDAGDAVSQLHDKALPFHKHGKLTVQRVYSAKFKARRDIYDSVVSRAGAYANTWRRNYVFFRAYPSTRVLKVEGESKTEVASAKSVLSGILDGVVAKDGSVTLWDCSLERNGELWRLIEQLLQELGVVVVRNKAKEQLHLFGTESNCSDAQRRLATLIREEVSSAHVVELDSAALHWACSGGFKAISDQLGAGKAVLDICSPPKIIISGSWQDYDVALTLVHKRALVRLPTAPIATVAEDCSVCWTEADTPVQTDCGHIYCQDCFENTCAAPPISKTEFALLCHGDQGNCRRAMGLQDMYKHLPSSALEEVFERSFTFRVRCSPNELRFCPTPDCGHVYRVTESARTLTCSNCLQPTCSACHEPHANMTCAEYKDFQSGGYAAFEKLKKEAGIKDCPKCTTPIEKTAGCNHMTCLACNAHICWVCMKVFDSQGPVYRHMSEMHGGHVDYVE